MESRKRRHFPDAFKRQAVERVLTSGLTITGVAEELGLHETVLRARCCAPILSEVIIVIL